MKTVVVKELSHESIAPYGAMVKLTEPEGFCFTGELHCFFPDKVTADQSDRPLCVSALTVKKPEKIIVTAMEEHDFASEIILPLDDDIIVHVAPPLPEKPDTSMAEAFLVPKGTAIKLNAGVWHLAPLPVNHDLVHVVILLPQRTYAEDCLVVDLEEDQFFEIKK